MRQPQNDAGKRRYYGLLVVAFPRITCRLFDRIKLHKQGQRRGRAEIEAGFRRHRDIAAQRRDGTVSLPMCGE